MDERTRNTLNMLVDAIAAHAEDGTEDSDLCKRLVGKRDAILAGQRVAGQHPTTGDQDAPGKSAQPGDSDVRIPETVRGATMSENQSCYIGRLLNERVLPERSATRGGMLAHLDLFHQGALSSKSASLLIDWLKSLPVKANARLATPKQLASVVREGERRDYDDADVRITVVRAIAGDEVTFAAASRALDVLFAAPFLPRDRKPATPATDESDELPAGMYRTDDGAVYKVQRAVHGSGRMYAKALVVLVEAERDDHGHVITPAEVEFQYTSGAISTLTSADRMGLDEAKAFGAIYGVCCQCGRTLTDERSIAEGIGPICAGKDMWA